MYKITFFIASIFFLLFSKADAQIKKERSLAGLDTVHVAIYIASEERNYSSIENSVKNKYELRLRQNDIELGVSKEKIAGLELNILMIDVSVNGNNIGYALSYELLLSQKAYLTNFETVFPYTWKKSGIITVKKENLRQEIINTSEELLDAFLNDYYSEN